MDLKCIYFVKGGFRMTPNQIIGAYKAIHELTTIIFPYAVTRNIANLRNRLKEEFQIIADIESGIIKKYGGELKNNSIQFPNKEARQKYITEYNSIMAEKDNVELPVVNLSKYTDRIAISPDAMNALEGIVIFEE